MEDLAKIIKKGDLLLTVTLKPELYKMRAKRQYDRSVISLKQILDLFCDRYIMIPELTKACNIHYHAIIHFKNQDVLPYARERFIDVIKIHKIFGNIKINEKPIVEINRTCDYITKEYFKTKGIIYCHNNKDIEEIYWTKEKDIIKPKKNIKMKLIDIDIE